MLCHCVVTLSACIYLSKMLCMLCNMPASLSGSTDRPMETQEEVEYTEKLMEELMEENSNYSHSNYIGFMFRKPDPNTWMDSFISKTTGAKYTHVDCVFIPSTEMDIANKLKPVPKYFTQSADDVPLEMNRERHVMRIMFSIYMQETFSYYVPKEWAHRSNDTHAMLLLQVCPDELVACWKYLMDLSDAKVPYNTSDLMLCCVPSIISRNFFKEVDSSSIPSEVFCSQAMILMLKQCIKTGRMNALLIKELKDMNSRATSPMEMFRRLGPHCMQVDVECFVALNKAVPIYP